MGSFTNTAQVRKMFVMMTPSLSKERIPVEAKKNRSKKNVEVRRSKKK
jgi:hypothetical protein